MIFKKSIKKVGADNGHGDDRTRSVAAESIESYELRLAAANRKLYEAMASNASLQGQLDVVNASNASLQGQLDAVNDKLNEAMASNASLQGQLDAVNYKLNEAMASNASLQGQLDAVNYKLNEAIASNPSHNKLTNFGWKVLIIILAATAIVKRA
ncbi:uncharacterized protein LOC129575763 isoform X2 [Sitodiplosis mosellana]|uniref:uncharacterized protein LOC129575763 isoform X2 n=1 Tax=Sitodiplosis mosellana TaxID=263140 RepID=UPI0024444965|nr:uncharacterized protein LOC129575763 isoform X2 [Sitodiplosis mosellana]